MWGAKEPFDNTYGKEPATFSIGLGGVIKAWDKGLAGLKEGARVMLICPPDTAYGKDAQARHPGQLHPGLRHRRARRRLRRQRIVSAAKSERLLNLVILLLVARNYTTKEQIRALMEPYRDSSDEAFDRMFERDKDDLRALGIPLEVGYVDKFFEDEQGYRIKRDAFELPEIDFTADEVAVLGPGRPGLAARRTGRGHVRRAGQAQGRRAQLRPRAARPGRARAGRRGARLRGDVAGDGAPHARCSFDYTRAGET